MSPDLHRINLLGLIQQGAVHSLAQVQSGSSGLASLAWVVLLPSKNPFWQVDSAVMRSVSCMNSLAGERSRYGEVTVGNSFLRKAFPGQGSVLTGLCMRRLVVGFH
jgi:hypothetical protein